MTHVEAKRETTAHKICCGYANAMREVKSWQTSAQTAAQHRKCWAGYKEARPAPSFWQAREPVYMYTP